MNLPSIWAKLQHQLASCFCDPLASSEQATIYRSRQFQAVLWMMPQGIAGNLVTSSLLAYFFWGQIRAEWIVGWLLSTWCIVGMSVSIWLSSVGNKVVWPVAETKVRLLTANIFLWAMSYAVGFMLAFGSVDPLGQVVLPVIQAGFIGAGAWMFSPLPAAGLAWTIILSVGGVLQLIINSSPSNDLLLWLIVFYCFVICIAVLTTARFFLAGLKAELEIEQQTQLISLLLNDFEQNACDWLWETDATACLRRVSSRLAEVFGQASDAMLGRSLVDLLHSLMPPRLADGFVMVNAFAARLEAGQAFIDQVVAIEVKGVWRWYSLTAKPLLDSNGKLAGWRGVGSDITAMKQREIELAHAANFDSLTDLPNRHQFQQRLDAYFFADGGISPCTLLLVDLDHFKNVNDSLGHSIGDQLLRQAAQRLAPLVSEGELVARLGGDEFSMILPGQRERKEIERMGARIRDVLEDPWLFNGHRLRIQASIGVASAPRDATSAEELLKASDMALYAAKATGRNSLSFFHRTMEERARNKLDFINDMWESLRRGEFILHYQPQIDLNSNRLTGFEALIRWQHPTRGLISPLDFISVAEESGLIVPLGAWVIRQACLEAMTWPQPLSVAVNLSVVQCICPDIVYLIEDVLADTGLPRERLEIEITESILLQNTENVLSCLHALRAVGIRIALDDFGTGYSSLSYLFRLPLDKLKIDRAFVEEMSKSGGDEKGAAIVESIIQLANVLKLKTIAEGVGSLEQTEILNRIGCTEGQGFHYSEPIQGSAVNDFVESWAQSC